MKAIIYRNLSISLTAIIIWILVGFFNHLLDKSDLFRGFELLIYFAYSLLIGLGLGLVSLLLQILTIKNLIAPKSFIALVFTLTSINSISLFLISIIALALRLLNNFGLIEAGILFGHLFFGMYFMSVIFKNKKLYLKTV